MKKIQFDSVNFKDYLSTLVDKTYKILPLYEEQNIGLFSYVQSLIYELRGLQGVVENVRSNADYITLLATLESLSDDAITLDSNKHVVKREVFKCIGIVKQIEQKISAERSDGV